MKEHYISSILKRRCSLLDAARGSSAKGVKHPLPAFALTKDHFNADLLGASPSKFHRHLCDKIRNAQERIYLASLYIGPGASFQTSQEMEFLDALQFSSSNGKRVKILMDQNRGLRQVPYTKGTCTGNLTSSAQAVAQAISNNPENSLHLLQVLSPPYDSLLPNPLNEVAGVFHMKLYIIDDSLIISGANLSQEYFVDRQDRYLEICQGGNGLVEFYVQLMDSLCHHSTKYYPKSKETENNALSKSKLVDQVDWLFQDTNPESANDLLRSKDTVAVCMPTFHAPKGFWPRPNKYFGDVDATLELLQEGSSEENASVQLSSAYLNPTAELLKACSRYQTVDLMTAGRLSHGFKPKSTNTDNKGKDWIPTVFDHLTHDTANAAPANIYHWERPDWTFHSKGLWLSSDEILEAAIVGSSNFGGRSFVRDMESNLIMVFPTESNGISLGLQREWREMMNHSNLVDTKKQLESGPPLPIHVQSLLPYIKSFF